jgi:thymidylate kinase
MDRIFLSEMVYNEYIDTKFYEQLVELLKRDFKYRIYFLTCDDDKELEKRITERLEADKEKGYGVRVGDVLDPNNVVEKFHTQKMLTERYISLFNRYQLDYIKIDTSDIPQKQVAEQIMFRMKEKQDA